MAAVSWRKEDSVHLNLEPDEASLVLRVLKEYLPNLREEIGKTENFDWRQAMHRDEEILKRVIARLEQAGVTVG